MSAVSEWIAREFFESLGFLVHEPTKYQVAARAKQASEEIDLLIVHPRVKEQKLPGDILWTGSDLKSISRAVVGVRGWHTDRFSPAVLQQSPEIYRFAAEPVDREVQKVLGDGETAKILCIPDLPASKNLHTKALDLLKEKGVDGVLLFRTMLSELIRKVDVKKNYDKSDLLQTLRILKNYGLLKGPQLDLFQKKSRSRKSG